jgi:zinc/manganese transport system substrate-binding protein
VRVVTSTNVYGDIASRIGGDAVDVVSVMSDPAQDPHSFEASAQNQLAVSKAAVVVENGGGYDDFMTAMLKAPPRQPRTVLNAVRISGLDTGGEFNEHIWYDFGAMKKVADALASALSAKDPAHAKQFQKNAAAFEAGLQALEGRASTLKAAHAGEGVAITEPVPLYLLDAIGLEDKTPSAFSHAIEVGTDVSPAVLQQTLDLFSRHEVRLLAYNEQTSGPETTRVLAAAKAHDVPVVGVTETLPPGKDYLAWMNANVDALAAALGGGQQR